MASRRAARLVALLLFCSVGSRAPCVITVSANRASMRSLAHACAGLLCCHPCAQFDVVLIDPPWEEYRTRCPGAVVQNMNRCVVLSVWASGFVVCGGRAWLLVVAFVRCGVRALLWSPLALPVCFAPWSCPPLVTHGDADAWTCLLSVGTAALCGRWTRSRRCAWTSSRPRPPLSFCGSAAAKVRVTSWLLPAALADLP